MSYFVKRDDKEYGPYSLADLQGYVQNGRISPNDLARSEGIDGLVPVSQIVGNISVTAPSAGYGASAFGSVPATGFGVAPARIYHDTTKDPPGLHWGLVLLLGIITLSLFGTIWLLYQSIWIRKLRPNANAMWFMVAYFATFVTVVTFPGREFTPFLNLVSGITFIIAAFRIRAVLEDYYNSDEPMGLSLSGIMTFFFSPYYFQYHLNEISSRRKAAQTTIAGSL